MATVSRPEGKKWINTGVAGAAILVGYVFLAFIEQMGAWFELESKVRFFRAYAQGGAVVIGLISFVITIRHSKSAQFLGEVFQELVKVIWPDKTETVRHTVGIIIGVTIAGFVLGLFDFGASKLLSLLH